MTTRLQFRHEVALKLIETQQISFALYQRFENELVKDRKFVRLRMNDEEVNQVRAELANLVDEILERPLFDHLYEALTRLIALETTDVIECGIDLTSETSSVMMVA